MSDTQSIYRCTPRQIRANILDCFEAGLVPFVISSPGMDKSAIYRSVAHECLLWLIDHRISTSDPTDFSGLPQFDNGFARFAPFKDIFPIEGMTPPKGYEGWLLFLDEFNQGQKQVQAAAYKLLLDKMIGQHPLHERVMIGLAGNHDSDRAIVNQIGTALESRTLRMEMVPDFDEWLLDVALPQNYDNRIVSFLTQYKSLLYDFTPKKTEKSYCCHRTWEFMNRLIQGKEVKDSKLPLYAGTITPGVAANFVQYCQIYKELISYKEILKDPKECRLPETNPLKWATVAHMTEYVNDNTFEDLAAYANRFTLDYRVLFYRSVMVKHQELRHHPAFGKASVELSRYLNAA